MSIYKLVVGLLVASFLGACAGSSDGDQSALGAEPRVFATGSVEWSDTEEHSFSWNLEEIVGFPDALTLVITNENRLSTRSASRQGKEDHLWFVAATMPDSAPVMVFGGADHEVDAVILVDTEGNQAELELKPVPDQDWRLAVGQLPSPLGGAANAVDVVALVDGTEIARERLVGLR